ncbi:hypothetical protein [Aestuariibaculum sediminum]|uniref:Uncharacterized protein n=1 Tax=Aestuariibaculum sediminum TaxID=2770637 RepID=A0A8J6Q1V8_9FLAO|nr:hypothetical protein [Aestuariibaculum sediminum]MBD0831304.1 hypothetical protein [Aestuariibaculum sediminum]
MKRNLYTEEEIILCCYIARFGKLEFDESDIFQIRNRSISSIKMKVQNIAAMLNEEGFQTDISISKLSGKPSGEKGRRTNWDLVKQLTDLDKKQFLSKCKEILKDNIKNEKA